MYGSAWQKGGQSKQNQQTRGQKKGRKQQTDWTSVAAKQLNLGAAFVGGWGMTACEHCCQTVLWKPVGPASESCPQASNPDFPFTSQGSGRDDVLVWTSHWNYLRMNHSLQSFFLFGKGESKAHIKRPLKISRANVLIMSLWATRMNIDACFSFITCYCFVFTSAYYF